MFGGNFSASSQTVLLKVNGIMNYTEYQDILSKTPDCLCLENAPWSQWALQLDGLPQKKNNTLTVSYT